MENNTMMTPKLAKLMLQHMGYIPDDKKPCSEVNPELWQLYCAAKNRPSFVAAPWWTEADVVQACDRLIKTMEENNEFIY